MIRMKVDRLPKEPRQRTRRLHKTRILTAKLQITVYFFLPFAAVSFVILSVMYLFAASMYPWKARTVETGFHWGTAYMSDCYINMYVQCKRNTILSNCTNAVQLIFHPPPRTTAAFTMILALSCHRSAIPMIPRTTPEGRWSDGLCTCRVCFLWK